MKTRTKLTDLNEYLFGELDRLTNDDLEGDKLKEELERAKAINSVSTQIISNAALALSATKFMDNRLNADTALPPMLEEKNEQKQGS
jgi:hypothetical protein